jgi:hypothetical protein
MKPLEIVCIVTITVVTGLVLIPFGRHFHAVGKVSTMAQCGKNIYKFLVDPDIGTEWDSLQSFQSSTDYFQKQLATQRCTVSQRLTLFDISAGMMPECSSADLFTSSNNAWTVLATHGDIKEFFLVPMLVSRNLNVSRLLNHVVTANPQEHAFTFIPPVKGQPKWGAWAVVVTRGGQVLITEDAKKGFFSPSDRSSQGEMRELTLKYLTPDGCQAGK